jgi:6-phosphogluconolactonase
MNSTDPSRRDFLAMSAFTLLGATGIARGTRDMSSDDQFLYVGSYTEDKRTDGIYLVRMNTRTGELRLVGSSNAGPNPSFLAIHPNGRVLYAVNEVAEHNGQRGGAVGAFAIDGKTGQLSRINEQSTEGAGPCYVSVDPAGRVALVANYDAGSVALLPIHADGSIGAATRVDQHEGSGPDKERQAGPHAHSIVTDPSGRFALGADLGTDRVLVYRLDGAAQTLEHLASNDARLRPGSGPRHIAFHPKLPLVFVANELGSTLTTLRFDTQRGTLELLSTQSTLPAGWKGASYVADIHVDSLGRSVYVSNRGHNSIALFSASAENGVLTLTQLVPTGGDWPRNFSIDPTERWLLVANQNSGSIAVFTRDPESGRLSATPHRLAVPSPVCLRFGATT